jgi:hypothetical protein
MYDVIALLSSNVDNNRHKMAAYTPPDIMSTPAADGARRIPRRRSPRKDNAFA